MDKELQDKIKDRGFRQATYFETNIATHSICKCGNITEIRGGLRTDYSHPCVWVRLVKEDKRRDEK